ncbi:MAG: hypothetical protein ACPG21_08685 [Crocinitomicaceae bacterium]
MKQITFLLTLPLFFIFMGCGPNTMQEGEVEYLITYPNIEVTGFMEAILPKSMTIVFKGTKMKTIISKGEIFSTEVISDEVDKSMEMRFDMGDKLYYVELTKDDLNELLHSQPTYNINKTEDSDSLVGLYAESYSVDCPDDTITHNNAWFTKALAPQDACWFSSYNTIEGFPLVYDVERYGVLMHIEAIDCRKREVKDSEFDRDPSLEPISFEDYELEVQELFDILLE